MSIGYKYTLLYDIPYHVIYPLTGYDVGAFMDFMKVGIQVFFLITHAAMTYPLRTYPLITHLLVHPLSLPPSLLTHTSVPLSPPHPPPPPQLESVDLDDALLFTHDEITQVNPNSNNNPYSSLPLIMTVTLILTLTVHPS